MARGKKVHFNKPMPKLESLGQGVSIPTLPKNYRNKLWQTIKVRTEIKLTQETEHFMNIMCLHFGISRNDLVLHAINLMWAEVVDSVGVQALKDYEDKLEAVRLYRLEKRELLAKDDKHNIDQESISNNQPVGGTKRDFETFETWSYYPERRVMDGRADRRGSIIVEEE